jgi:hypothetical protein
VNLQSAIYQATDFGGASDGTPDDFALSQVRDFFQQVEIDTSNKKKVGLVLGNLQMLNCLGKKMKSESGASYTTQEIKELFPTLVSAGLTPRVFQMADGREIPMVVVNNMARHCLYGLCTEDLIPLRKGKIDYRRWAGGDIWFKSPNNRYSDYEAWKSGWTQLGATACDGHVYITDLLDQS